VLRQKKVSNGLESNKSGLHNLGSLPMSNKQSSISPDPKSRMRTKKVSNDMGLSRESDDDSKSRKYSAPIKRGTDQQSVGFSSNGDLVKGLVGTENDDDVQSMTPSRRGASKIIGVTDPEYKSKTFKFQNQGESQILKRDVKEAKEETKKLKKTSKVKK
jgi:hypothetical protein